MNNNILIPRFRALVVDNSRIIGARGYKIYSYCKINHKLNYLYSVKDFKYSLLSKFSLLRRFFRAEITGLYTLNNGVDLVIAKKGIFKRETESSVFLKCFDIPRGSRPLNLCVTPDSTVYFGEYFGNANKEQVHIYKTEDSGKTWTIAYTFPKSSINHIHGIFHDTFTNRIWVTTGDIDNECMIGYTDDKFVTFTPLLKGGQQYRACFLLFFEDSIVYATDSQYIKNTINIIDRQTLEVKKVYEISGSGIYGGQSGSLCYVSSTIEPSNVNTEQYSHLYISLDGKKWNDIVKYKKDVWHKSAFQFGSIQFPRYNLNKFDGGFVFSGRSLKYIDGKCVILKVGDEK